MTIKKTALSTSIILIMGLAVPAFSKIEGMPTIFVDDEAVEIECVPQAELDLIRYPLNRCFFITNAQKPLV